MELIIALGSVVFFLLLGLIVGGTIERMHFGQLATREEALNEMIVTQIKTFPGAVAGPSPPTMLVAEVVISSDYLKSFLAGLKKIVGGELGSFRSLLERARREACLRIMEQAHQRGYNALCNLRLETADIGSNNRVNMVCIIASGTAYQARLS